MVEATRIRQNGVLIKLGNTANPIVYAAPCAFTERSARWEKTTAETDVPDCGDPGLPGWVAVDIISRLLRINGGGILATEAVPVWFDAWDADAAIPARVEVITGPSSTYSYTGLLHVTNLELIGNRSDGTANIRAEGVSTGPWIRANP